MKNSILTLGILLLWLVNGCGTSGKIPQEPPKPQWLLQPAQSDYYYTGVGSAPKTGPVNQYQKLAEQNALKDLAEEISVSISSTSVLRKLQSDYNYSQDFSSVIATSTSQHLEDYELVDTYENSHHFYAYYRLSKDAYVQNKRKRVFKAKKKAVAKYQQGVVLLQQNDFRNGISMYIKALEDVFPYLDQSLDTTLSGKSVDFGIFILNQLEQTFRNLVISPEKRPLKVRRFEPATVRFSLTEAHQAAVAGFPLKAEFSAQVLNIDKAVTNRSGVAIFEIPEITTTSDKGVFTVRPDVETLLVASSDNFSVRNIIRKMTLPESATQILIAAPGFFVQSQELAFGKPIRSSRFKEAFITELAKKNFRIATSATAADYQLDIMVNTAQTNVMRQMYVVWLQVDVKVTNQQGATIYSQSFFDIKGIGLNKPAAAEKAYQQGVEAVHNLIFNKMYYAIFE
jgi:hypothetical protein